MGSNSSREDPSPRSRPRPGRRPVPYQGPYMPGPVRPTGMANRSYYEENNGPDNRTSQVSHRANREYYGYKNQQDGKNGAIKAYNDAKRSKASQSRLEQLARNVVYQTQNALDARIDWMTRYEHESPSDKVKARHREELASYQRTIKNYKRLAEGHRR